MDKRFLEIKDNDVLISSAVLYIVELRSRKLAVLEEVKTTEGYRNKGYGEAIVRLAIIKAKEAECDTIELCYNSKDTLAFKLYNKCGFKEDNNVRAKIILNEEGLKKNKW